MARLQAAAADYVPVPMTRKGPAARCPANPQPHDPLPAPGEDHQALFAPSLRHTFATQLLNAGASLEVVKELMGHRSLQMTLRYTQLYDRTKRAQYDHAMAQVEQQQGLHRR